MLDEILRDVSWERSLLLSNRRIGRIGQSIIRRCCLALAEQRDEGGELFACVPKGEAGFMGMDIRKGARGATKIPVRRS